MSDPLIINRAALPPDMGGGGKKPPSMTDRILDLLESALRRVQALEARVAADAVIRHDVNEAGELLVLRGDGRVENLGHIRGKDAPLPQAAKAMRTRVTKHDEQGRILEFIREEVE